MIRRLGFYGVCLVTLAAVAGCSPEGATDSGYYLSSQPRARAVVNPSEYMTAVGCSTRSPSDAALPGDIGIPSATSTMSRFGCASVPGDSIRAAIGRYKDAVASGYGSNVQAGYWNYYLIDSREWCYGDGVWNDEEHYFQMRDGGAGFYGCFWVDTYSSYWVSYDNDQPTTTGGGGSLTPNPTPAAMLCPPTDAKCLRLPTKRDSAAIRDMRQWMRPYISDTLANRECSEALAAFNTALGTTGAINVGTYDTGHTGNTFNGVMHIDPRFVVPIASTATQKEGLRTMLHESMHLQGKNHPVFDSLYSLNQQTANYNSDPWFRSIESTASSTSCAQ